MIMNSYSKIIALACALIAMQPAWSADLVFRSNLEPADSCSYGPPGLSRQTAGNVTYVPGFQTAYGVDLTKFENIWGRSAPGDQPLPWPSVDNQIAFIDPMYRAKYLAAQFTVPALPLALSGSFKRADISGDVTHTSASISETCGDFYVDLDTDGCAIDSGNRGSPLLVWAIGGNLPPNVCSLKPGHTYYLNIMMSPLDDPPNSWCHSNGCVMSGLSHVL